MISMRKIMKRMTVVLCSAALLTTMTISAFALPSPSISSGDIENGAGTNGNGAGTNGNSAGTNGNSANIMDKVGKTDKTSPKTGESTFPMGAVIAVVTIAGEIFLVVKRKGIMTNDET